MLSKKTFLSVGYPYKGCHEMYLYLPIFCDWDKICSFSHLKEKLYLLTYGWKKKPSSISKEISTKSVFNLFFVCYECIQASQKSYKIISCLIRIFWWRNNKFGGVNWLFWKEMYLPKALWGLGFQDFENVLGFSNLNIV